MNINLFGKKELKYEDNIKKRIIYFVVEDKETGDIWVDTRDFNMMESKYNPGGWKYEDITRNNGRILVETIYKKEVYEKLNEIKRKPLGFKIEKNIKESLEKIAKQKNISLIELTQNVLSEYISKNRKSM